MSVRADIGLRQPAAAPELPPERGGPTPVEPPRRMRGARVRPDRPPTPTGMRIVTEGGASEAAVLTRALQITVFVARESHGEERAVMAHVVWALRQMAAALDRAMPEAWAALLAGWPGAAGQREGLPPLPQWYPVGWVGRRIESTVALARSWNARASERGG